jgi:hypothetical protein
VGARFDEAGQFGRLGGAADEVADGGFGKPVRPRTEW